MYPMDVTSKAFSTAGMDGLVNEEEQIINHGAESKMGPSISDDETYYIQEEELLLDIQGQDRRQEEKRKEEENWDLIHMSFKA